VDDRLHDRPLIEPGGRGPYRTHQIHHRAFTPRQCERIIAHGSSLLLEEGTLESADGSDLIDDAIRSSGTAWIPPSDDTWWIYERIGRVAERANVDYGFDLTGFAEDLQFTIYDEVGSFYTWHQDGLDGNVASRKLSIVIQLSDPAAYEGARLEFFDVASDLDDDEYDQFCEASGRQGTAVVFPSWEYHQVQPLAAGVRHSLVAWVNGPPFR
jgi:PKHD-type hydroxylase